MSNTVTAATKPSSGLFFKSAITTKSNKLIGLWLLGGSGMVFGAVILGKSYELLVKTIYVIFFIVVIIYFFIF